MAVSSKGDVESYLPLRPVEFEIMLVLAEGESHGYAIMRETERRTGGRMRIEPGTLYRAIKRMSEGGLIAGSRRRPVRELDDERRRYFRLTPLGRQVASAEARRLETLVLAASRSALLDREGGA